MSQADVGLKEGRARLWGSQMCMLVCPGAGICLLVNWSKPQSILGLLPTHCWVKLVSRVVLAYQWRELNPEVAGRGGPRVLELV